MKEYLDSTPFIESSSEDITSWVNNLVKGCLTDRDKAIKLYYAVRDDILYDPYGIDLSLDGLRSTTTLREGKGYCVSKSILLSTVARCAGIPSRIGFANVKNHLTSEKLKNMMKTDIFAWHGYTELYIEGVWVKATPAFNASLCEKAGIKPLEFNGKDDSIFHPIDNAGRQHMEYITDHGCFQDVPLDALVASFKEYYPEFAAKIFQSGKSQIEGSFENEASSR